MIKRKDMGFSKKKIIIGLASIAVLSIAIAGTFLFLNNKFDEKDYTLVEGKPNIVYFYSKDDPKSIALEDTIKGIEKRNENINFIKIDKSEIFSSSSKKKAFENWAKILDNYDIDISRVYISEGRERPTNDVGRVDVDVPLMLTYNKDGGIIGGLGSYLFDTMRTEDMNKTIDAFKSKIIDKETFKKNIEPYVSIAIEDYMVNGM